MNKFLALARATHWPQALTMVFLVTAWSAILGQHGIRLIFVLIATAAGQASVGWVNDYVDAKIDRELNRTQKPSVQYSLDRKFLKLPIFLALLVLAPFSFLAAGFIGGLAHILAVGSAQIYNLYLSRTVMSWLPYAVSFSLLPVFVTQSSSALLWPTWPITFIAALVGVIAHIFNALPDLEMDRQAKLGGFVVSLGKTRSIVVLVLLMALLLIILVKTFLV